MPGPWPELQLFPLCAHIGRGKAGRHHSIFLSVADRNVIVGFLAVGALVTSTLLLGSSVFGSFRARVGAWTENLDAKIVRVVAAGKAVRVVSHPMALVAAQDFMKMEVWECHEVWRDKGKLLVLDSLDEIIGFKKMHYILFISHQWLGSSEPDTKGCLQMHAMKHAVSALQDEFENPIYVWLDYLCVAQRHTESQKLAIAALSVYVSVVDLFVTCAPDGLHRDTGSLCGLSSYSRRGWCRMEMLAKAAGSGLSQISVSYGDGMQLRELHDVREHCLSFCVYEGEFTRNRDKETLVQPILGLYSLMLRYAENEAVHDILEDIWKDKARFFPPCHEFDEEHNGQRVTRELFGNMPSLVEKHVSQHHGTSDTEWADSFCKVSSISLLDSSSEDTNLASVVPFTRPDVEWETPHEGELPISISRTMKLAEQKPWCEGDSREQSRGCGICSGTESAHDETLIVERGWSI